MTQAIQKRLNDSAIARWIALILIALMMFFAYMFVDVMSPLQTLIESQRSWTPDVFGTYAASEYILNVCGFLIVAGIILDKMGIRFTGTLSASLMVIGAAIKYVAISDWFQASAMNEWLSSWWVSMPGSAKLACLGFMIFGCGCEMAGITVSRAIAKWFDGKEMALAMGLEMAIARLGVFAVLSLSPWLATKFDGSVVAPVAFCTVLLLIGLINFIVFSVMDSRLDKQIGASAAQSSDDEKFKPSDIKYIFQSKMFWLIALLCVLYYSAIFPFQRYATNFLESTLEIPTAEAANIFRWFPILAMILTPLLGSFIDYKGKGASMLLYGALIMIICHLSYAFLLPLYPTKIFALLITVILGVSFSLVPAALWPSVPKVIDGKILGSAYSLIFWVQNVGLCFVPKIIGNVLNATNPGVAEARSAAMAEGLTGAQLPAYDYTVPMMIFASFGVVAFILGLWLKHEDKVKGYGLELPNIKK
ncbi:MAG TPA: MFS transporter [Candidatus Alistipes avicola]|uniref:Lysosomal dipeptide transporter MFSD1 n=1 Tax=Candidatus Alistipes avicola TaxID=2838432 RepID=A0A9D2L3S5_9BACT|nr:MFS transporter [uncultured Alistipes sp.]HJA98260.1 MFS transporter [Candidatus Alistipes avicola]